MPGSFKKIKYIISDRALMIHKNTNTQCRTGGHDLYQEAMGQRLPSLLYLTRTHFTVRGEREEEKKISLLPGCT
jgi:hypothetical protein